MNLLLTEAEMATLSIYENRFGMPITTFCFIIPTILVFYYIYPIGKAIKDGNIEDNIARRRVLNSPIIISLLSMIGWLLAMFLHQIVVQRIFFPGIIDRNISKTSMSSSLFVCIFNFVFVYYFVEALVRLKFIPYFFPDGKLKATRGVLFLPTYVRFIFLFVAITLFPISLFLYLVENFRVEMLQTNYDTNFLKTAILLVLCTGSVMFIFSKYYREIMFDLRNAARSIREGDFSKRVEVTSVDVLGQLSESFNEMAKELEEKEHMRNMFGKLVDPTIRDYVLKNNFALGGKEVHACIMFTDIRNFTSISEKLSPTQVLDFLNEYFEMTGQIIAKHNGIVNKFMGDGCLALFGVPIEVENPVQHALNASIEIQQQLEKVKISNFNSKDLQIGIGIHYGLVLVGNMGSKSRMEFTVIGDAVNTASRVESQTKVLGKKILITEAVFEKLENKDEYSLLNVGEHSLKGKDEKIQMYSIEKV